METLEKSLFETLRAFGYRLLRVDGGYQIRDQETGVFYLGEKEPASLREVHEFVNSLDENGVPDLCGEDLEDEPLGEELSLDMEITKLTRYRDTLRQQGKLEKAAELDAEIQRLEDGLAESEEENAFLSAVRSFLQSKGYRVETRWGEYRVTKKATGDIVLGRTFDANVKDMAAFAERIGMEPFGKKHSK